MRTRTERLKYTKENIVVITAPTGVEVWDGIDYYYNDKFRDKVICRVDAVRMMTDIFSKETLEKYRDVIFNIAASTFGAKELSAKLLALAQIDEVFAMKLNEYYYTCDIDCSFGEYIINSLADRIRCQETRFREFFRGMTPSVICLSLGYLYICVPDIDTPMPMPKEVHTEVISYAKNWKGDIKWAT